jgi:hypothetical protein
MYVVKMTFVQKIRTFNVDEIDGSSNNDHNCGIASGGGTQCVDLKKSRHYYK